MDMNVDNASFAYAAGSRLPNSSTVSPLRGVASGATVREVGVLR